MITQTVLNIRQCNFGSCLPSLCWMHWTRILMIWGNVWILCCFEIIINSDISVANMKHYIFKSYKWNTHKILVQCTEWFFLQKVQETPKKCRKTQTRLKTNLKLTMLNNTKLRHFWAQIASWAPRHARKTFSLGPMFLCWVVFKIRMSPWWTKNPRWRPFSSQLIGQFQFFFIFLKCTPMCT